MAMCDCNQGRLPCTCKLPPQAKWFLRHQHGCGKPAFYMAAKPYEGYIPEAQLVWFPDGSQPQVGWPYICGSCGTHLDKGLGQGLEAKDLVLDFVEER